MERSYWLHRIKHHREVSYPLIDRGILSIGFSGHSTREFVATCVNRGAFDASFQDIMGYRPKWRWGLWRFLGEMKRGDYVVVPSEWGTFSVYEIEDDTCMTIGDLDLPDLKDWHGTPIIRGEDGRLHRDTEQNDMVDLGFFRRVKPVIKEASRSAFADRELTKKMKYWGTNLNISPIQESIEAAISAFKNSEPINIHELILDKSLDSTLSIIRDKLNPEKLEQVIVWYLEQAGATSAFRPPKNETGKEGDADVIATFEPIKTIIYVQAKLHAGEEASTWALEQIRDYREYKSEKIDGYSTLAWVISTADSFSEQCIREAERDEIQLISGRQFARMILEVGISTLDEALT